MQSRVCARALKHLWNLFQWHTSFYDLDDTSASFHCITWKNFLLSVERRLAARYVSQRSAISCCFFGFCRTVVAKTLCANIFRTWKLLFHYHQGPILWLCLRCLTSKFFMPCPCSCHQQPQTFHLSLYSFWVFARRTTFHMCLCRLFLYICATLSQLCVFVFNFNATTDQLDNFYSGQTQRLTSHLANAMELPKHTASAGCGHFFDSHHTLKVSVLFSISDHVRNLTGSTIVHSLHRAALHWHSRDFFRVIIIRLNTCPQHFVKFMASTVFPGIYNI